MRKVISESVSHPKLIHFKYQRIPSCSHPPLVETFYPENNVYYISYKYY